MNTYKTLNANATPEGFRQYAAECLEKAERASNISQHAGDNAPGSYVTGRSGRSAAMDRKTERAIEKSIKYSKIAVYWRRKAAQAQRQAAYLENPEVKVKQVKVKTPKEIIPMNERLFIGAYPTGLVYSDRGREVNGDYRKLAYLNYKTLILELEERIPPELKTMIEQHAATIQAKRGQPFNTSLCGQPIILGE